VKTAKTKTKAKTKAKTAEAPKASAPTSSALALMSQDSGRDLIAQGAKDIKIRLTRGDILGLAVNEMREKMRGPVEASRQRCENLHYEITEHQKRVEAYVLEIEAARVAGVLKAMAAITRAPLKVSVSVSYTTKTYRPEVMGQSYRRQRNPPPSTRYRSACHQQRVDRVETYIRGVSGNDFRSAAGEYSCYPSLSDFPTLATFAVAEDALTDQLFEACEQYDRLSKALNDFERSSKDAKQRLIKRVLEESEKGREVLALAAKLGAQIDLTAPAQ